jgi:hypothetical protein
MGSGGRLAPPLGLYKEEEGSPFAYNQKLFSFENFSLSLSPPE